MYGTIKVGDINFSITSMRFSDGVLIVSAMTDNSRKKDHPTKGQVTMTIIGEDGSQITTGLIDAGWFKDACEVHKSATTFGLRFGMGELTMMGVKL